jgi:hypothetical protein
LSDKQRSEFRKRGGNEKREWAYKVFLFRVGVGGHSRQPLSSRMRSEKQRKRRKQEEEERDATKAETLAIELSSFAFALLVLLLVIFPSFFSFSDNYNDEQSIRTSSSLSTTRHSSTLPRRPLRRS